MSVEHTCSRCRHRYLLRELPNPLERIFHMRRAHIPFAEYVYVHCPKCGHKDWADERRFFGILGPRGFYGVALLLAFFFVALVYYLGFVGI